MKTARMGGAMLLLVVLATAATAQSPAMTKITLTELHCAGCAKKVAKCVNAVPGVAEVRLDLKARTFFVMHRTNATPSPRALWEAVEQADHAVERMVTPTATYTSKPGT
jgi:copper chaperone CopZ